MGNRRFKLDSPEYFFSTKKRVNQIFSAYIDKVADIVKEKFTKVTSDDTDLVKDELECFLAKRLYPK